MHRAGVSLHVLNFASLACMLIDGRPGRAGVTCGAMCEGLIGEVHELTIRSNGGVLNLPLASFLDEAYPSVAVHSSIDTSPPWVESLLSLYERAQRGGLDQRPRLLTPAEVQGLSDTQIYDGQFMLNSARGVDVVIVEFFDSTEVRVRSEDAAYLLRLAQRLENQCSVSIVWS